MSSSWIYSQCVREENHEDMAYHHPEDPKNLRTSVWRPGVRHKQCCMVFLGTAAAFMLKVNLSVAIVSMTRKTSSHADSQVLPWNESMKGTVLSAMFWTYCLIQVPGGQLAEKFGPKLILTMSLFFGGVISILTPVAVIYGGFYWTIFMRVIQGIVQGVLFPTINYFVSKWAPTPERGRLITFVFNGCEICYMIGMTMSGVLADSRWGWPSAFYVPGAIAIAWALAFWIVGADSPQHHPTISESERTYILNSQPSRSKESKALKTPWKDIFTSHLVWILIIIHCAHVWTLTTKLTQIPSYLNGVFGLSISKSGFLSSLPYLCNFIMGFIFVAIDNKLSEKKLLSRITSKRLWNSVGSCGPAFALCLLAFSGQNETFALALLAAAGGLNNAVHLGFLSNHLDLAPNFAGTLMGVTNMFAHIGSFIVPLFAGFVVDDPTSLFQWQIVFLTAAGIFFVANLMYVFFCSVEVQSWNSAPEKQKLEEK